MSSGGVGAVSCSALFIRSSLAIVLAPGAYCCSSLPPHPALGSVSGSPCLPLRYLAAHFMSSSLAIVLGLLKKHRIPGEKKNYLAKHYHYSPCIPRFIQFRQSSSSRLNNVIILILLVISNGVSLADIGALVPAVSSQSLLLIDFAVTVSYKW